MARPLHVDLTPGLPLDGSQGQFIGCDAAGTLYLLQWLPKAGHWAALGWPIKHGGPWPELRQLHGDDAHLIVGHVQGPDRAPAAVSTVSPGKAPGIAIEGAAGEGMGASAGDRLRVADRPLDTMPSPKLWRESW